MTDLDRLVNAAPAADRNADPFRIQIQNRAESTHISTHVSIDQLTLIIKSRMISRTMELFLEYDHNVIAKTSHKRKYPKQRPVATFHQGAIPNQLAQQCKNMKSLNGNA